MKSQDITMERLKNLEQLREATKRLQQNPSIGKFATEVKVQINKFEKFGMCICKPKQILAKAEEILQQYSQKKVTEL